MQLLTTGNPKTAKGTKLGYLTAVMHLQPHKGSGVGNVCPMATAGCAAACLNTAGRGGIGLSVADPTLTNAIQRARTARTLWYFTDRAAFMAQLVSEIEAHLRAADRAGLTPCVRLNGTSDLRFERVKVANAANVMARFPDVQFYDYTKLANRVDLPDNYDLTYSLAEGERSWRHHLDALANGMRVAVVLRGAGDAAHPKPLPPTWHGVQLVDGDKHDLRFIDPAACYVGLRAKGRAKADRTGFVHDLPPDERGKANAAACHNRAGSAGRSDQRST